MLIDREEKKTMTTTEKAHTLFGYSSSNKKKRRYREGKTTVFLCIGRKKKKSSEQNLSFNNDSRIWSPVFICICPLPSSPSALNINMIETKWGQEKNMFYTAILKLLFFFFFCDSGTRNERPPDPIKNGNIPKNGLMLY